MRRRSEPGGTDQPRRAGAPWLLLVLTLVSCERRETVTVPRPVFAVCPETPCRVPVSAVRGSILAGERRPHDVLIDLRDFAARHPRQSPFRFAPGERRKATFGRIEVWIQTGETPRRVTLTKGSHVIIDRLLFPQAPTPGTTTVFRSRRPALRPFRCQDHGDAGTWFAVPWISTTYSVPPIRKPSIQMRTSPTWTPMTILVPEKRHFVLSRLPESHRASWMALIACLGPVSLGQAEPGLISTAQASGVSLWQWAAPEGATWRPLAAALAHGENLAVSGDPDTFPVVAAAVKGRRFHVETVDDPVDFLSKMLAAGHLSREEAWAAWTRMLLAGHPATGFARLREALTTMPE